MGKALGQFRATYLAALCCVGSFLFAYDAGVVGGVLTLPSFVQDFGYTTARATTVSANSTSLLQAGGKQFTMDMDLTTLTSCGLLRLLLHLAVHCTLWASLVSRSCLMHLQHRCGPSDYQLPLPRLFLCCASNQRCRCRHGHSHYPHVLR